MDYIKVGEMEYVGLDCIGFKIFYFTYAYFMNHPVDDLERRRDGALALKVVGLKYSILHNINYDTKVNVSNSGSAS
ncbi:hypothetical protein [Maribacter sp. 2308TA10-17]|uniref:hypothetical protein n=1 Tax=Maribacter sp. 2308TA10-17 TaxID=3386276 RepID=UPI0039BC5439